ncbi:MAG TPA: sigma-70 family RNA polymerase sigma factor [Streptosporangiaceae bacterium]|nr:sigma-70 family RNA polymerase sigma factor [Streptosporangiaceae bacterium]
MTAIEWEQALPELRARLLRRARSLGTDLATAEDLVQDTLSEAWRLRDRLYDPAGIDRWLSAILTNVHRRWLRQHARDAAHTDYRAGQLAGDEHGDGFDVEAELERHELAELLDRAMGLLPEETRHVLVQRFVAEMPIGELAGRLGVSQGAVRMRLQRGKLALREVLTTTCQDDALAYGIIREAEAGWQATRIWCPHCGAARLRGRFCEPRRRLEMACPLGCEFAVSADSQVYGGVTGFRPALRRATAFSHGFFRDRIRGFQAGLTPGGIHEVWADDARRRGPRITTTLSGHALSSPEGRRFWHEHPRIRLTAHHELAAEGEAAVLTSFTSVGSAARLDVVLSRDSLRVIRARRQ